MLVGRKFGYLIFLFLDLKDVYKEVVVVVEVFGWVIICMVVFDNILEMSIGMKEWVIEIFLNVFWIYFVVYGEILF